MLGTDRLMLQFVGVFLIGAFHVLRTWLREGMLGARLGCWGNGATPSGSIAGETRARGLGWTGFWRTHRRHPSNKIRLLAAAGLALTSMLPIALCQADVLLMSRRPDTHVRWREAILVPLLLLHNSVNIECSEFIGTAAPGESFQLPGRQAVGRA